MPPAPAVFLLTVEAVAGPQNSVPDGKRYSLLVFARGGEEAQAVATGEHRVSLTVRATGFKGGTGAVPALGWRHRRRP